MRLALPINLLQGIAEFCRERDDGNLAALLRERFNFAVDSPVKMHVLPRKIDGVTTAQPGPAKNQKSEQILACYFAQLFQFFPREGSGTILRILTGLRFSLHADGFLQQHFLTQTKIENSEQHGDVESDA